MKEKWIADFSSSERSCFIIKSEISYNANLEKNPTPESEPRFWRKMAGFFKKSDYSRGNALFIGLKKKSCMAWLETADRVYVDQVIRARFRYDSMGGYCAAGIMFRVIETGTYYLALVCSKGYFRLDAVNNNIPRPLVGWTESHDIYEQGVEICIISMGDHHIFIINGRWIAETYDSSIPGGHLGFALVSYDADTEEKNTDDIYIPPNENYSCKAWLDYLSVDSRNAAVEADYIKWNDATDISADSRLQLAESYAALDRYDLAYDQITKVWKQREDAARSVMATYTEMRSRGELLFAAQMASKLEQYAAAEEYIDIGISMISDDNDYSAETMDLFSEKVIVLSAQNKFKELAELLPELIIRMGTTGAARESLPLLYSLLGYACWNLDDYEAAAIAWDYAFKLNKNNGLYAVHAADAWAKLGKNTKALKRWINGGNRFLEEKKYKELEALIPRLLVVGKKNWAAHALAGKWASAAGNKNLAKTELALSEKLKNQNSKQTTATAVIKTEKKPGPPAAKTKKSTAVKKPVKKPPAEKKPGNPGKAKNESGAKEKKTHDSLP
ncbi:MAG: hypothetical protein FWG89_10910 [Treponema sp.]|nr:hypothetical protein [Treponema sp.]